jgi:type VI secretion system secreted protein VgrG
VARLQETREIEIATPLGDDVLLFQRMTATEQLGRLFEYQLDVVSKDANIKLDDLLGQNVTVRLKMGDDSRFFNGYVSRFCFVGMAENLYQYQITLRPWLWFLTRTADCRIFQNKKVPDIIKQIFRDHGFSDFEEKLSATYRDWEYCVQYRETDFNFVSRLMEQEGMYYYFKHEDAKHTLVLADSIEAHESVPDYEEVPFFPYEETLRRERDHIFDWFVAQEVQPGTYALNDFDFEKPKADLNAKLKQPYGHSVDQFEVYDYPGEYLEKSDGDEYVRKRVEELHAQYQQVQGQGNARGLTTGCLFTLTQYPRDDQNKEYLITSATYELQSDEYGSAAAASAEQIFMCSFTAIDSAQPFRTPRVTPKPVVQGPQTAMVVGPKGEEIHTDKHGRVKVQFHWDREGAADENSSCFIRVSHAWAGKNWGAIALPRIGQEVIVDFLEGDPDHPLVTGRVYNEINKPPYELPANATISTFKTNSSKGGEGFNEFRFEDKKGEEQIFMHAEKNMDIRVKNDRFETIGHDRSLVVENDKKEHIKNERHEVVDSHHMEKIGADRNLNVEGKEAKAVADSLSLKVSGDVIEEFGSNHSEQVSSDYYLKASNIVIEGTTNVTVKVGQSYIAIDSGGIKIGTTGTIELEATGTLSAKGTAGVTVESPATTDVKGSMTTVKGDAVLTLEGGLVKIN